MKKYLFCMLLAGACAASCGKFLEEYSQNAAYVESVNDLEELLYGSCFLPGEGMSYLHLVADESRELVIYSDPITTQTGLYFSKAGLHRWMQNPFSNYSETSAAGDEWDAFYKRISVLNSILLNGEPFWGKGQDAQLAYVMGSCRFLRAWNYLMLVNIYGEAYDKNNPSRGIGIPYKTDPTIEETKFSRDNVGHVYDKIAEDLREAARLMEIAPDPVFNTKVSVDACHALLSRVYLYMEQYDQAVASANRVNGRLWNIAGEYLTGKGESFLVTGNPEIIFAQGTPGLAGLFPGTGGSRMVSGSYVVSITSAAYVTDRDLEALFDSNDARYSAFFARSYGVSQLVCRKYRAALSPLIVETDPVTGNDVVIGPMNGEPLSETSSLRYAEVTLNKAEAQACMGDETGAATTIAAFLSTRYALPPAIPAGKEELIRFIRLERQKELCFEGHRWFDLRRYAVNSVLPQTKEIVHEYHDLQNTVVSIRGKFTLLPYNETNKGSWIFPIPETVVDYCFPNLVNLDRAAGVVKTDY
ncbi:MAG: RagB/SusD family nutrient uptake outer membrane protein [Odoribacteraceae bacterium]|jgi:hypothetical protein|nr:RagB/SusD family nutrient uptake outer membrane protein [Odoribacteraceae bacterium]